MGAVQKRGDGGNPAGIAGEDAIAANVSGLAADMKLLFHGLHGKRLQSVSFYPLYQTAGRFSTGVPNCGFISRFSEQPSPAPAWPLHPLVQHTSSNLRCSWSGVRCRVLMRSGRGSAVRPPLLRDHFAAHSVAAPVTGIVPDSRAAGEDIGPQTATPLLSVKGDRVADIKLRHVGGAAVIHPHSG